jgi:uncharacterized membrane protein YkoI
MLTVRWISTAAWLGLLVATMAAADETKIEVSDLPKVVVKAAKKAFPQAKIVGAAKEAEDGETIFEVMMKLDGKSIDLAIDDEGDIEEIEREINFEDLPRAVINAARARFPTGEFAKVEEVSDEDDKVVYELTVETEDDETVEVFMSPNGKILDSDEEDEDDDEEMEKKQDKDDDEKAKTMDKDDDEESGKSKKNQEIRSNKKEKGDDDKDEEKPKA